jgi:hypothetical protein
MVKREKKFIETLSEGQRRHYKRMYYNRFLLGIFIGGAAGVLAGCIITRYLQGIILCFI